jgi:hypothetical protein
MLLRRRVSRMWTAPRIRTSHRDCLSRLLTLERCCAAAVEMTRHPWEGAARYPPFPAANANRVSSFRSFHGVALLAGPEELLEGNLLRRNHFRSTRSKLNLRQEFKPSTRARKLMRNLRTHSVDTQADRRGTRDGYRDVPGGHFERVDLAGTSAVAHQHSVDQLIFTDLLARPTTVVTCTPRSPTRSTPRSTEPSTPPVAFWRAAADEHHHPCGTVPPHIPHRCPDSHARRRCSLRGAPSRGTHSAWTSLNPTGSPSA